MVTTTLETMPAAATHWSTRSMAKASGLSISTVHRIWRAFSLQPHRSETFKLSADPLFVDKRCYGASGEDNGTIVAPANQRSAPCHS